MFDDERAGVLHDSLGAEERALFRIDAEVIDWRSYLHDLHLPGDNAPSRHRAAPLRVHLLVRASSDGGPEVLAVFDLEGTVLGTNVVDTYLWIRLAASPRNEWARRVVRSRSQRRPRCSRPSGGTAASSCAASTAVTRARRWRRSTGWLTKVSARPSCPERLPGRLAPHPRASSGRTSRRLSHGRARLHDRADGSAGRHRCRRAFARRRDRYTGELEEVPYAGDARASFLRRLVKELGADLSASYAYGDSISDLPMLESVGNPVAVNPDPRLRRIARERRWAMERWRAGGRQPAFHSATKACGDPPMIALRFSRSVPRYAASRLAGRAAPGFVPRIAPLRLGSLRRSGRSRVTDGYASRPGSQGSADPIWRCSPATLRSTSRRSSRLPFVPGHEIVGTLLDATTSLPEGARVVIEPVLACAARGIEPMCEACARGEVGLCARTAHGHHRARPSDRVLRGHRGRLGHDARRSRVAAARRPRRALRRGGRAYRTLVVRRARRAPRCRRPGPVVLVAGAGTMGLLTVAALRAVVPDVQIIAVAKHDRQRAAAEHAGSRSGSEARRGSENASA